MSDKFKELTIKAIVHADGDVYVQLPDKSYRRIGKLGESTFGTIPDPFYIKIKKWMKQYVQQKTRKI